MAFLLKLIFERLNQMSQDLHGLSIDQAKTQTRAESTDELYKKDLEAYKERVGDRISRLEASDSKQWQYIDATGRAGND